MSPVTIATTITSMLEDKKDKPIEHPQKKDPYQMSHSSDEIERLCQQFNIFNGEVALDSVSIDSVLDGMEKEIPAEYIHAPMMLRTKTIPNKSSPFLSATTTTPTTCSVKQSNDYNSHNASNDDFMSIEEVADCLDSNSTSTASKDTVNAVTTFSSRWHRPFLLQVPFSLSHRLEQAINNQSTNADFTHDDSMDTDHSAKSIQVEEDVCVGQLRLHANGMMSVQLDDGSCFELDGSGPVGFLQKLILLDESEDIEYADSDLMDADVEGEGKSKEPKRKMQAYDLGNINDKLIAIPIH